MLVLISLASLAGFRAVRYKLKGINNLKLVGSVALNVSAAKNLSELQKYYSVMLVLVKC